MALRMAKLTRTPTGLWTARKVIPEDVRQAFGKREDKPTWPASLTQAQARAEFGAWLLQVEERIAALRSTSGGPSIDLSQRQSLALAGRWYDRLKNQYEDNPGGVEGWQIEAEKFWPEDTAESYAAYVRGDPEPYDGPWKVTPWLRDEAEQLLAGERLRITESATDRLLQNMAGLYQSFCQLMAQRAQGDYSVDRLPETLPDWQPVAQVEKKPDLTISGLFDAYVATGTLAPATVKAWRRMVDHLVAFLGHDDARKVIPEDIVRWRDNLLTTPTKLGKLRTVKTVRETYLAAVRSVFQTAKDNLALPTNPADGIKVRGAKPKRLRDPGFTNDEAKKILAATLQTHDVRLKGQHALARRWVPWLCAYTGARVNEITQLRKCDVIKEDGVWAINITPDAGSTKTNAARKVPLHSHLVDQGFLGVVDKASDGPLFYDPQEYRGGSDGNPLHKKVGERLARWVRGLGVDDPNVQPNHAWRHRFKTIARGVRMDHEARSMIPGHAPATEGEGYGAHPLPFLSGEIEKLPRYQVED
jgi:integrase